MHVCITLKTEMANCYFCKQLQMNRWHYQNILGNTRDSLEFQQSLAMVFSEFFWTEVSLQEQFRQDNLVCKICRQLIQTYVKSTTKVQKMEVNVRSLLVEVYQPDQLVVSPAMSPVLQSVGQSRAPGGVNASTPK